MKAEELRINNWIIVDAEYAQLGEDAMEVLFASRNYSDCQPIPLTPEILEAAGFERRGKKYWYHPATMFFELLNITALENGFRIIAGWPFNEKQFKGISNEIKYLHQLQNLYFALTRTELVVNLKEKV